ncbi:formate dehydrogenase subunit gamma [Roseibium denhamense]|uniref:Formate dehydrogenase gamma subunit n=1 Tax=Roseibium denhamense TaxID=76305 RepID=A0ABY1NGV0_9HYPH|nr:formate dehydrogenase subunit gamma [Roseibium denhamense]MTI06462.1 formate dehydrogenase subunit gamma [Roseibium denhamense]SMP09338.1 formate dehydrogenase gamma subunit [Roseibium denhamense]
MIRFALVLMFLLGLAFQASAQELPAQPPALADRSATGGAQTLEDILKRQRGEKVDNTFRSGATGDPDSAAEMTGQLGTLGGVSDPELWRALRFGSADITVTSGGLPATVLIQDGGMRWLQWREGPVAIYGAFLLAATIAFLVLFYLLRGRIRIDGEKTGQTITRFKAVERFGHWLLAGSFILLGVTGLITLFGRTVIIPLIGHEAFSPIAIASKWIHNNVSWAFMLALVMVFVMWVVHNIPSRIDLKWIAVGGGLFSKGVHPPARKFNFGQKMIFWGVIVLGTSVSASGLSLLFPFELPMFAATFKQLNAFGLPQLVGLGPLPEVLAPHEEMQYAQIWHTIVAFVMMAMIIAHIYIGSVGMEGAYDAMGSGEVELQWAREHHGLWVKEVEEAENGAKASRPDGAVPAE